jgi:hypothetical protein
MLTFPFDRKTVDETLCFVGNSSTFSSRRLNEVNLMRAHCTFLHIAVEFGERASPAAESKW